jgi:hypothetical protein
LIWFEPIARAYPVLFESGIPKDLLMRESGLH